MRGQPAGVPLPSQAGQGGSGRASLIARPEPREGAAGFQVTGRASLMPCGTGLPSPMQVPCPGPSQAPPAKDSQGRGDQSLPQAAEMPRPDGANKPGLRRGLLAPPPPPPPPPPPSRARAPGARRVRAGCLGSAIGTGPGEGSSGAPRGSPGLPPRAPRRACAPRGRQRHGTTVGAAREVALVPHAPHAPRSPHRPRPPHRPQSHRESHTPRPAPVCPYCPCPRRHGGRRRTAHAARRAVRRHGAPCWQVCGHGPASGRALRAAQGPRSGAGMPEGRSYVRSGPPAELDRAGGQGYPAHQAEHPSDGEYGPDHDSSSSPATPAMSAQR